MMVMELESIVGRDPLGAFDGKEEGSMGLWRDGEGRDRGCRDLNVGVCVFRGCDGFDVLISCLGEGFWATRRKRETETETEERRALAQNKSTGRNGSQSRW